MFLLLGIVYGCLEAKVGTPLKVMFMPGPKNASLFFWGWHPTILGCYNPFVSKVRKF